MYVDVFADIHFPPYILMHHCLLRFGSFIHFEYYNLINITQLRFTAGFKSCQYGQPSHCNLQGWRGFYFAQFTFYPKETMRRKEIGWCMRYRYGIDELMSSAFGWGQLHLPGLNLAEGKLNNLELLVCDFQHLFCSSLPAFLYGITRLLTSLHFRLKQLNRRYGEGIQPSSWGSSRKKRWLSYHSQL